MSGKRLRILGSRGVPASHGGFETFAEKLSLYLVSRGWDITVYCQEDGLGESIEDEWHGVRRVRIPIERGGAIGTIIFDWKSTVHASREKGCVLTLGYGTAVFSVIYRLMGIKNIINMDGIEWKRQKWSALEKAWLYFNERIASVLANHLIADHPEIKTYLCSHTRREKITMIPYGADCVKKASTGILKKWGLKENGYCIIIARIEPENLILEMVSAFSRKRRGHKLVVLGRFSTTAGNTYHRHIMESAGPEVIFPGAVYEKEDVRSLRSPSVRIDVASSKLTL